MKENSSLITPATFVSGAAKISREQASDETIQRDRNWAKRLAACSSYEARTTVTAEQARKLGLLPLAITETLAGKVLLAAVTEKSEIEVRQALRFLGYSELRLTAVSEEDLARAIFIAYEGDERRLELSVARIRSVEANRVLSAPISQFVTDLRQGTSEVTELLSSLIDYALAKQASDVHLVPTHHGTNVQVRINGIIHAHGEPVCNLRHHQEVVSRIKVLSNLNIAEKRLPQDGSFEVSMPTGERRGIRVGVMPTHYGERVSLRFHGTLQLRSLSELGFDEKTETSLGHALQFDTGLILFAGPTGSGKSTTLYSALERVYSRGLSVLTIEDPIEQILPFGSQTSIDRRAGFDFAMALRAALRQDPQAILVGEIRDRETASTAIQAAQTGHMILSSIHANDARTVSRRLAGLGLLESELGINSSLVVYQRLLPRLCQKCRIFDLLGTQATGFEVYMPTGCRSCEMTGFDGRVLVAEAVGLGIVSNYAERNFCRCLEEKLRRGDISYSQFVAAGGKDN